MNTAIRRPASNAQIAAAMVAGGSIAVWLGAREMAALGHETMTSGLEIGIGLVVGIIGFFMTLNFIWAMRVMKAIRDGKNEIARWIVSAEAFDAFRANNEKLDALGRRNDYRPPRSPGCSVSSNVLADAIGSRPSRFPASARA